ncbi:MAG: hypothetical protein ABI857_10395, partial [Acidobacteriota bacterium]
MIENLTRAPKKATQTSEPGAREIVVTGSFEAVNRYFYEHEYGDGLPIVPPTQEKVADFLRYTDRSAD